MTVCIRALAFPGGSVVKTPPTKQGTVRSLGQEIPLENEMATHSSILAWEILWTEELGGLPFCGVTKELDTTERHSHLKHQLPATC